MQILRRMTRALAGLALPVFLFFGPALPAQEVPVPNSPILTIDPERLFSESLFGKALLAQVQADTEALALENRRIEADLTAEERDLAIRRPTMDPDAFRTEAAAFDGKVQDIRQAQDAKEAALQSQITTGREDFFQAARPILGEMMLSFGAGIILDRRSVFLSVGRIDITDQALDAVNAAIGDTIAPTAPATGGN